MPRYHPHLAIVLFLSATIAVGQIRHEAAKAVEESDGIRPLLLEHQKAIAQRYEGSGVKVAHFSKWVLVDSAATRQLFPGLRFASIEWDETADPRANDGFVSLAGGLQTTLAIDPKAGTVVATLPGHGNYEAFGALLVDRKVTLRTEADAKLIWEAFCDLHHKHWKDQPHERVGDNEWRLGRSSYEQTVASDGEFKIVVKRTHFTRIRTDPKTFAVLSWESVVATTDERKIRLNPD